MNPFERWDDWEWERAAQSIGRDYRFDGKYDRDGFVKERYPYNYKPEKFFMDKWTGSQKRVLLSALMFLTVVFSYRGGDPVSQTVYSAYRNGIESGNFYSVMNSMAKEAIGIQNQEGIPVEAGVQGLFYPPVAGIVKVGFLGSGYNGEPSRGIEIESSLGTPVLCPEDGVVVEVSENERLGKAVRINFGNGWEAVLGNFADVTVEQGQPVSMGLKLGTVGVSSFRQKSWAYLELLKDGKPVNPLPYLIQNH